MVVDADTSVRAGEIQVHRACQGWGLAGNSSAPAYMPLARRGHKDPKGRYSAHYLASSKTYGLELNREPTSCHEHAGVLMKLCTPFTLNPDFAGLMQGQRCDKVRLIAVATINVGWHTRCPAMARTKMHNQEVE